jgi:tetratricopeptide (TPR) repeat protein
MRLQVGQTRCGLAARRWILLATVLTVAVSPRLEAQAPAEARERNEAAKKLFHKGKFLEAAREWERVYRLTNKHALLFNIGQAYRNGQQVDRAIAAFKRYLDELPRATNRADVEAIVRELEAERDHQRAESPPPLGPGEVPGLASGDYGDSSTSMAVQTESAPLWRKWWFWTAVGVVVVGASVAAVVASSDGDNQNPVPNMKGSLGKASGQW